jgi:hypothetical protein
MFKAKPGPKRTLDCNDLAFHVAYALGKGMGIQEVAAVAAISSSTVWRLATKAGLTNDPRCHEIIRLVHESETLQADRKNQDDEPWDPGLDLLP